MNYLNFSKYIDLNKWDFFALINVVIVFFYFPVVADEAYFMTWGEQLSLGYYDHPGLTGWFAYPFSEYQNREWFLRALSVFAYLTIFFMIKVVGKDASSSAATAWAILPLNFIFFGLYLNDTWSYFFSILFVFVVGFNFKRTTLIKSILAGVFLGLALNSKYISAFYAISYVITLIILRDWFKFRRELPIVVFVSSVIFSLNIYWNLNNCNVNFAFNFFSRGKDFSGSGVLEFVGSLILISFPVVLLFLKNIYMHRRINFFGCMFIVSILLMALTSLLVGGFGTHWAMPIGALLALGLAGYPNTGVTFLSKLYATAGSVVLCVMLIVINGVYDFGLKFPADLIRSIDFYDDLTSGEIERAINNSARDFKIVTPNYSLNSMLRNNGVDSFVMFTTSKYGRNQDLFDNPSAFDGMNLLIISDTDNPILSDYQQYFSGEVRRVSLHTETRSYAAITGIRFDYDAYEVGHMRKIFKEYYDHPVNKVAICFMDRFY
ncbi:MAG: glycosyltransferase family 39 protein [Gammaproteobacteria bacterium]|nr:glycosyltransferase family 39 protein [Gammaproteobacteria bacterium]